MKLKGVSEIGIVSLMKHGLRVTLYQETKPFSVVNSKRLKERDIERYKVNWNPI